MNKKSNLSSKDLSLELSEKLNKELTKKLINSQINFQVVENLEIKKSSLEEIGKIDVQTWLDNNYPKGNRNKIKEIYLNKLNLEGKLDFGEFTYRYSSGTKVYIPHYLDESKLEIKNKSEKVRIIKLVSAQEYLNRKYSTNEEKKQVVELNIQDKLEGKLNLSDFVNLKRLNCSSNKLTSLNLSNCSQLEEIDCSNNQLINLILPSIPTNIKELNLSSNNFPLQDLSFLTSCTNLERLELGNDYRANFNELIYNKFTGSLDYLNVNKLPSSLKEISYEVEERPTSFLSEIFNNKLVDDYSDIVPCYGISQDPKTKDYLMVMKYVEGGLSAIHEEGLVHCDFHAGNILNDHFESYITDLGMSKPAYSQPEEGKIYGVLPYVAPEVLCGKKYIPESDIYSFGIIMYEVISGLSPYYNINIPHDYYLAVKICQGLRPKFQIKIPQLLEDLIKQYTEFTRQLQATEQYNKNLTEEIRFPKYELHKGAVYHSQPINTQQISELVKQFQETKQISSNQIEITQQIKAIENKIEELKKSLDNSELIDQFIKAKKQSLKNSEDKQLKKETGRLKKQLIEKGFPEEKINEVIRSCEELVRLEQQLEQEQFQTHIEQPPK
ncbi:kinase-like domain-containing protein [Glomus cerebriforme]|uniref:Kinase-like domain-containing protein n=1 Tax=Glomus cerebriforme TaxID=658196 RepID=A0A397SA40_9GLOM|nr:kinase-like domain-containing protein [Glomus cerebriforme]